MKSARSAPLWILLTLTACASTPARRIFVLAAPSDAAAESLPAPRPDGRLHIAAVAIPDYLDSTDILVRRGPHELVPSPTGRWGERLAVGLREALASDLGRRLPLQLITTSRDRDPLGRQLLLTVATFDVWPDGRCVLSASWSILDQARGSSSPPVTGTFVVAPSTPNRDAGDSLVVASMAAAVAMLADRIAKPETH